LRAHSSQAVFIRRLTQLVVIATISGCTSPERLLSLARALALELAAATPASVPYLAARAKISVELTSADADATAGKYP
jgi:hypothetical protein